MRAYAGDATLAAGDMWVGPLLALAVDNRTV